MKKFHIEFDIEVPETFADGNPYPIKPSLRMEIKLLGMRVNNEIQSPFETVKTSNLKITGTDE